MNSVKKTERIEKWDIARGILIFLVVLCHMLAYHTDYSIRIRALYIFIYSFLIPSFLFCDGLFSKKNIDEKRYSHIFSYLIMYLVIKILVSLTLGIINHNFTFDLFAEKGTAWYGLALFWLNLLTIFLKRFPKKWVLIGSIILACFIGYDTNVGDFLVLSRTIVFFPFFFLGYCIDPNELTKRLSSWKVKISGAVIMLIVAIICIVATDSVYFIMALTNGNHPYTTLINSYGMDTLATYGCITRFVYYIITFVLCMSFFAIIPEQIHKFHGLTYIGKHSLQIYILHRPIEYILYVGFDFAVWLHDSGINALIIIPIAILITIICSLPIWEKPIQAIIYPWKFIKKSTDT